MNRRIKKMHKRNGVGWYSPEAKRIKAYLFTAIMLLAVVVVQVSTQAQEVKEVPRETTYTERYIEFAPSYVVTKAKVTGYNTVEEQTDATPCIAAGNVNICGRSDVVACPRALPLGTKVEIDGKMYECLDRTALKHDGRFDISCDKDMTCPAKVTGTKEIKIYE